MGHLDLLGPHYLWLLIDDAQELNTNTIEELLVEGDNVAVLQRLTALSADAAVGLVRCVLWKHYIFVLFIYTDS